MTQGSTAGRTPQDELERALAALAERAPLEDALGAARAVVAERTAAVTAARALIVTESEDVRALEGATWRRLMAAVRGTTHEELSRERAQVVRAEAAYVLAVDQHEAAVAHVDELRARLARTRDAEARVRRARGELERALLAHGGSGSARLEEIATQVATLRAEGTELAEAVSAASTAAMLLARAEESLDEAIEIVASRRVLVVSGAPWEALAIAAEDVRRATAAVARLDAELADVRVVRMGSVGLDRLLMSAEAWTDAFVFRAGSGRELVRTRSRVSNAFSTARHLERSLTSRASDVKARIRALDEERSTILARS